MWLDVDDLPGSVKQAADVSAIAGYDVRAEMGCRIGHCGVHDVAGSDPAEQSASGMGLRDPWPTCFRAACRIPQDLPHQR